MKRVIKSVFKALVVIGVLAGTFMIWIARSNRTFGETFYTLYSYKIETPVRAILLTDLHEKRFRENNQELISRIRELKPDLILIAGDVINKTEPDMGYAVNLCQGLAEIAPVYYGLGNHENEVIYGNELNKDFLDSQVEILGENKEDFGLLVQNTELLDQLEKAGIQVIQNQSVETEIKGNRIEIGGISTNLSSFWPYSGQFVYNFSQQEQGNYKILLSHRPEPIAQYIAGYPIDLVVSGHNHGGVIRIPRLGGLLSADGGLFPDYDGGMTEWEDMAMIVSRGLGGHGIVPRIFNQPELVIIDVN